MYCRADAFCAFLYHSIGQPDHYELESGFAQHFNGYGYGIYALEGGSCKFYKHLKWY